MPEQLLIRNISLPNSVKTPAIIRMFNNCAAFLNYKRFKLRTAQGNIFILIRPKE
jgi:hypothetical protein